MLSFNEGNATKWIVHSLCYSSRVEMYTYRLAWPQYFGMLSFSYFSSKCSQGRFFYYKSGLPNTYMHHRCMANFHQYKWVRMQGFQYF